jgi:hypothetical protein
MPIVPGFDYVWFQQESNAWSHDQDSTSGQNWMWYLIVIIDQGLWTDAYPIRTHLQHTNTWLQNYVPEMLVTEHQ